MFSRTWFILRYWFCWILFFEIARIAFLLKNYIAVKNAGISPSLLSLWYGARMDASLAAYVTIPVALIMMVFVFITPGKNPLLIKIYTGIVLLICLLLILVDLNLFQSWGYRIDASVLKYLSNPKEVYATIAYLPLFWIGLFFIIIYLLILFAFNKLLSRWYQSLSIGNSQILSLVLILFLLGVFIIPIRGGFQLAPLNQSSVYFSQNNFANLAAINAPWNFMYSVNHNIESSQNPFDYLDKKEAHDFVDSLYSHQPYALQQPAAKTNVIIIVWESFTEKATHLTVQGHEITPGFNALKNDGIYFSNIYASGDRTDKGIVAVLSGYPAQPITSIVKEPGKASKLPMLSTQFSKEGYHTAFYYGGELEFANIKAYLLG
ncbi:MAG: sulfatase-like hydrolase/transferase, partial [Ferruginibacter sp.]